MSETGRAYRGVLATWGSPMEEGTWLEMVAELRDLAQEYGEDLADLMERTAQ